MCGADTAVGTYQRRTRGIGNIEDLEAAGVIGNIRIVARDVGIICGTTHQRRGRERRIAVCRLQNIPTRDAQILRRASRANAHFTGEGRNAGVVEVGRGCGVYGGAADNLEF